MRSALRDLEAIYNATALSLRESETATATKLAEEQERARRVANMAPYQQAEYHCAESIALLRRTLHSMSEAEDALAVLEQHGGRAATTSEAPELRSERDALQRELMRARQVARRAAQSLRTLEREAQRLAQGAGHAEGLAYKQLHVQVERALAWYREAMHIRVLSSTPGASSSAPAVVAAGAERRPLLLATNNPGGVCDEDDDDESGAGGREGPYADQGPAQRRLAEDVEFESFFTVLRQNDGLIDTALDRIAAGVYRLRDNALAIQDELQAQHALLDVTEAAVAQNKATLQDVNRRLYRALRELRASTLTTYLLCLLCLLGVLCVLVHIASEL